MKKKKKHKLIAGTTLVLLTACLSSAFITSSCDAGNSAPVQASATISDTDNVNSHEITAPPPELGLDTFYKKYLDASGIPVISSDKVPDEALFAVQKIVNKMLSKRPDVLAKLIENKMRVGIMAKSELTKDMPEHSTLQEDPASDRTWNDCRGVGATVERPLSSCAEENVLCYGKGNDPYYVEDITIHEFAHGIHGLGISFVDPGFDEELQRALDNAKASGLWENTYAATDSHEYFAEAVQCWFNINAEAIPGDGIHNEINTRAELKKYDLTLYNIVKRYFKEDNEKISCHQ